MTEKFHYITQGNIKGYSHSDLAEIACRNGIKWVQLRVKGESFEDFLNEAQKTKAVCQKYGAKLIINDNVTIAREVRADGIHLGKEDMDPLEAREILGEKFIVGGTSNTLEDILDLAGKKVDYVGLGPFRFTATKEKLSPILGLEGYKSIVNVLREKNIKIPVIAIGGITTNDIKEIMQTGVHGIAVASVINKADDKAFAIQKTLNELNHGEIAHSR